MPDDSNVPAALPEPTAAIKPGMTLGDYLAEVVPAAPATFEDVVAVYNFDLPKTANVMLTLTIQPIARGALTEMGCSSYDFQVSQQVSIDVHADDDGAANEADVLVAVKTLAATFNAALPSLTTQQNEKLQSGVLAGIKRKHDQAVTRARYEANKAHDWFGGDYVEEWVDGHKRRLPGDGAVLLGPGDADRISADG